jgi:hypothetical protein
MRDALRRAGSTTLAIYIGAIDALIWLGALPFELYCKHLATQPHEPVWALVGVLMLNLLLLALIAGAALATGELIRRGFTRRAPVLLRVLSGSRSRRSVR